jgi:hypothetical protein
LSVLHDQTVERLLAALHARSDEQVALERDFYDQRTAGARPPTPDEIKAFRSDKLVALIAKRVNSVISSAARTMRAGWLKSAHPMECRRSI